jgi:3-oxoacyl-[acyl-carrier-protein] synthase II
MMMPNAAAGAVAIRLGIHGPGFSVASACATGAHAIGESMRMIERGTADVVVAGGTEAALTSLCIAAFRRMGALSSDGVSRPFDARRDGFVMGEGAGVLVLEDEQAAVGGGATVLARLAGIGTTSDAFHLTAPDPSGGAAAQAIKIALADARVSAADVDYVNAHGTGTPLNDASETQALKTALGRHAWEVPVSSAKSAIGHLLGGAGAVEAVATISAMREGVAPPTLHYEIPDDALDLDYVALGPRPIATNGSRRVVISNSFGFGGHNVVLVFTDT